MKSKSTLSRSRRGFEWRPTRRLGTARPTSYWVSTANRSPPPSILFCPIAGMKLFVVVRSGFPSLTTVTPTAANRCRIDVVAAWNVFYYVPLVTSIAKFFGNRFVRQDQETMIQQAQGLKHNPSLMLIDDADRPAKWYFALKQARLEGRSASTHPMPGPVTLKWRS